ncbi:MAG TPA: OpgC domain-containing protein, partial [Polyangiales bacterium]
MVVGTGAHGTSGSVFVEQRRGATGHTPGDSGMHYHALDFLRGVSALVVLWKHFSTRVDLPWLAPCGVLAVDFFFVLSGFVVASAYGARLQSGALSLKD